MDEYLKQIEVIMDDIGVYLEVFDPNYLIEDIILDSLSAISFYIAVEDAFQIAIPDEMYTDKMGKYSIKEFCEKVIKKLVDEKKGIL